MTVGSLILYLTVAAILFLVLALMARLLGHQQHDRAAEKRRKLDDLRGRGA